MNYKEPLLALIMVCTPAFAGMYLISIVPEWNNTFFPIGFVVLVILTFNILSLALLKNILSKKVSKDPRGKGK